MRGAEQPVSADGFTKMSIYGINLDLFSSSPIVILKVEDENRYLPIWIGQQEARSILMKLQDQSFSRPLTHDLALSLVNELGGNLDRITVTELKESTFFATMHLSVGGREVEIDSRPSDAIAIAVRAGCPIFAADDVIEEAAVVFEEAMEETPEDEVVDKFKDWMNQVSPEDFRTGP
jgi:bifunctional DNase/RNase